MILEIIAVLVLIDEKLIKLSISRINLVKCMNKLDCN